MNKLRNKFWADAKALIKWCSDEELRVLGIAAKKELNTRIDKYLGKVDEVEESKKKAKRNKAKQQARGLK